MFVDRKDAAGKLGVALEQYKDGQPVVLGIPRGGVETAYYVARHLKAEFSSIITRKLGFPSNPESAFGAVAEDGSLYLSEEARPFITETDLQEVLHREMEEVQRRVAVLRGRKPLPSIRGRNVILVDDGIATGATLFAAIAMCKKQGARRIIVAAPVAGPGMVTRLRSMVDDAVILETPNDYYAVSQVYKNFANLTDEETRGFLSGPVKSQ